jgi:hypothetical protein
MTKLEASADSFSGIFVIQSFVIISSFVIRHSSFQSCQFLLIKTPGS